MADEEKKITDKKTLVEKIESLLNKKIKFSPHPLYLSALGTMFLASVTYHANEQSKRFEITTNRILSNFQKINQTYAESLSKKPELLMITTSSTQPKIIQPETNGVYNTGNIKTQNIFLHFRNTGKIVIKGKPIIIMPDGTSIKANTSKIISHLADSEKFLIRVGSKFSRYPPDTTFKIIFSIEKYP